MSSLCCSPEMWGYYESVFDHVTWPQGSPWMSVGPSWLGSAPGQVQGWHLILNGEGSKCLFFPAWPSAWTSVWRKGHVHAVPPFFSSSALSFHSAQGRVGGFLPFSWSLSHRLYSFTPLQGLPMSLELPLTWALVWWRRSECSAHH